MYLLFGPAMAALLVIGVIQLRDHFVPSRYMEIALLCSAWVLGGEVRLRPDLVCFVRVGRLSH